MVDGIQKGFGPAANIQLFKNAVYMRLDGLFTDEKRGGDFFPVFATDLDRDGDIDVLSARGPTGSYWNQIVWYENDGDSLPSFFERLISGNSNWPFSLFAEDVDGDGDTDVLSASIRDNKIAWYENDGSFPPGL